MPTQVCLEPSCANPAAYRGRCPAHTTDRNRQTRSRNAPLYNTKRWQITRRHKLSLDPLCEQCGHIATDVHHRQAVQAGGAVWAMENLEALCHACHSRQTRREQTTP